MNIRNFFSFLFLVVLFSTITFSCEDKIPEPIYGTKPVVAFTATQSPSDIFTWSFANSSTGAVSYSWGFGDGGASTEANPSHTYSGAGVFAVTLTATAAGTSNAMGWTQSLTQSVQIDLPTYGTSNVTFSVDMKNAGLASGDVVNINGTFNGWCGGCNEMTDADSDKVYEITLPLATSTLYEYKFTINGWSAQEQFGPDDACAYTATGEYYNRPLQLGNLEENVAVATACYNSCDVCVDMATVMVGKWNAVGMGVGPNKGDEGWWSYARDGSRACLEDDTFEFKSDGTLTIDLGADTWLETWQGVGAEACGAPVAPHVSGDYSWSLTDSNLKLVGEGAYLVLAKAVNGGELSGGAAQPSERTYELVSVTANELVVDMNIGHGYWRFYLGK